jgi:hypothetical protein
LDKVIHNYYQIFLIYFLNIKRSKINPAPYTTILSTPEINCFSTGLDDGFIEGDFIILSVIIVSAIIVSAIVADGVVAIVADGVVAIVAGGVVAIVADGVSAVAGGVVVGILGLEGGPIWCPKLRETPQPTGGPLSKFSI